MDRALDYLREQRKKHFDPDCVDAFLARMDDIMVIQEEFGDE